MVFGGHRLQCPLRDRQATLGPNRFARSINLRPFGLRSRPPGRELRSGGGPLYRLHSVSFFHGVNIGMPVLRGVATAALRNPRCPSRRTAQLLRREKLLTSRMRPDATAKSGPRATGWARPSASEASESFKRPDRLFCALRASMQVPGRPRRTLRVPPKASRTARAFPCPCSSSSCRCFSAISSGLARIPAICGAPKTG